MAIRRKRVSTYRPQLEALESRTLPATFTVTTAADLVAADGFLSLREAINAANADALSDNIEFNIAGAGPHTIQVGSTGLGALPTIIQPVTIDGTTEPDFVAGGTPVIELDGSAAGALASGLTITGGNSTVRGLAVNRFGEAGILLSSGGHRIEGNHLGTNPAGIAALANGHGIIVFSSGNIIGGAVAGQGNVISGNTGNNVFFGNGGNNNAVLGNRIGTDANGAVALGGNFGVTFVNGATGNVVGGTKAKRNVISGNSRGVGIGSDAPGNTIEGNFIGLDSSGTVGLGNTVNGVVVGSSGNTIVDNVIADSSFAGVLLTGASATANLVQGNRIGTAATATGGALPNEFGILIQDGAAHNLIGGTAAGDGNLIAFNNNDGVRVVSEASDGNRILGNSIHSNGALGINLAAPSDFFPGVTPNDAGDADTGPNDLQNFPVLSFVLAGPDTLVMGNLNSLPGTQFRVEVFASTAADPSGFGEGQRFLGAFDVMTNGAGNVTFAQLLPGASAAGEFVTATATHLKTQNTSEFSGAVAVKAQSRGCEVLARDGTLFILGDDTNNVVDVRAEGASVRVTCDNARTVSFDGISQIVVGLAGGDDMFDAVRVPPPDPDIAMTPLDLFLLADGGNDVANLDWAPGGSDSIWIDLGAGSDTFDGDLQYPPDPVAPEPLTLRVSVLGGAGIDRITSRMGIQPTPFMPNILTELNIDGGTGNDSISALAEIIGASTGDAPPPDVLPQISTIMNVRGGDGADRIVARMGVGPTPFLPNLITQLNVDGGAGDDTLAVHGIVAPGTAEGFNPQPEPPIVHFDIKMLGGDGNDEITARMGVEPTPFLPAMVQADLNMDGGAGNDILSAEFTSEATEQKVAELHIALFGGDGDDFLSLLWNEAAFNALGFVDGGAGLDAGLFSPGVKHKNVERVG